MDYETVRKNRSIEELNAQLDEVTSNLLLVPKIANPAFREERKRRLEFKAFDLSEEIINRSNCLNLMLAVLHTPSDKRLMAIQDMADDIDTSFYEDNFDLALESMLRPYKEADEETRRFLDKIKNPSYDRLFSWAFEQVPPQAKRAFIVYEKLHTKAFDYNDGKVLD